jgi:hypothetical protein
MTDGGVDGGRIKERSKAVQREREQWGRGEVPVTPRTPVRCVARFACGASGVWARANLRITAPYGALIESASDRSAAPGCAADQLELVTAAWSGLELSSCDAFP